MPLDKDMSHEDMVKELIKTYKKTGKIGATEPKDMEHALEIANAVAYNIGESKEAKAIERNVTEMTLDEILESMEKIISDKEKELGISEIEENPKVKVTLDSGETFETEVDPATSEDELEQQYKIGTELNVGKEGQERKARIKSATLTRQVGEKFFNKGEIVSKGSSTSKYKVGDEVELNGSKGEVVVVKHMKMSSTPTYQIKMPNGEKIWAYEEELNEKYSTYEEDVTTVDNLAKKYSLNDEEKDKLFNYLMTAIPPYESDITPNLGKAMEDTEALKSLGQYTNEELENPPAVIENPTDVVSLDIPLLMRLLEWSREQAREDVDLHVLTENLVEAMKDTEFLTMDDYERLVPCEECNDEEELEECDGSCATTSSDMGADQVLPFGKKNKVKKLKNKKSNRMVK